MRTEDPNPQVETGYTEVCFLGVHVVTTFVLFHLLILCVLELLLCFVQCGHPFDQTFRQSLVTLDLL